MLPLPRFAHRTKAGHLRRRQAAYFKNVIFFFELFNYCNSHSVCAGITLNPQYLMKIISRILQPGICESLIPISMFATTTMVVSPLTRSNWLRYSVLPIVERPFLLELIQKPFVFYILVMQTLYSSSS